MIIISTVLNLVGLLLNFIGFIGVYKHRENIFGRVSSADVDILKQQLSDTPKNADVNVSETILKKVTKATDYFICIMIGFLLEFIAVALSLFTLISQTK